MTDFVLPSEWTVGIKEIDKEHQELLTILFMHKNAENTDEMFEILPDVTAFSI